MGPAGERKIAPNEGEEEKKMKRGGLRARSLFVEHEQKQRESFCQPISCSYFPRLFFSLKPIAMAPFVPPPVSPFRPDLLRGKVSEAWKKKRRKKLKAFFFQLALKKLDALSHCSLSLFLCLSLQTKSKQTVLVTGGSSGIGLEIARQFGKLEGKREINKKRRMPCH